MALSSSTNAANFSSAGTTNLFPSPVALLLPRRRCTAPGQIVHSRTSYGFLGEVLETFDHIGASAQGSLIHMLIRSAFLGTLSRWLRRTR